ncbi:hypothetical protein BaRGS_00023431 [Batillaria attramentaria]|uniref:Uncharacterized protein n=1 Tax=Batillaria attramentaria TaxID=370345 RepID=A0ABD0KEH0_9CAEN
MSLSGLLKSDESQVNSTGLCPPDSHRTSFGVPQDKFSGSEFKLDASQNKKHLKLKSQIKCQQTSSVSDNFSHLCLSWVTGTDRLSDLIMYWHTTPSSSTCQEWC